MENKINRAIFTRSFQNMSSRHLSYQLGTAFDITDHFIPRLICWKWSRTNVFKLSQLSRNIQKMIRSVLSWAGDVWRTTGPGDQRHIGSLASH